MPCHWRQRKTFICYKLITPQRSDDGLKRWDCQLLAAREWRWPFCNGWIWSRLHAGLPGLKPAATPTSQSLSVLQSWWINVIQSWDAACASYFSNRNSWRLWENWSGKGCFSLARQCVKSSRTTGCVLWWAESRLLPKQSAQGHADTGDITWVTLGSRVPELFLL